MKLAAISYDSPAILRRFAAAYHVGYPLLSDPGSKVIRAFGILNTNIPPGHPFYGIPFPGQYLIEPDGIVRDKIFLPDYHQRATGAEVLLLDFGRALGKDVVEVKTGELSARVILSVGRSFRGDQLGLAIKFALKPGWHVYGEPLPSNYIVTSVSFDPELVAHQSIDFPRARPLKLKVLGETLPVYEGEFQAPGRLLLKPDLKPGQYKLGGTLRFQACNDEVCKLPEKVAFQLPLTIEPDVARPSAAR